MSLRMRASEELRLPVTYLDRLARTASHLYKRYSIRKRTGGSRRIDHPARQLKAVQRWLLHNVIDEWPVHDSAHAYRRTRGIRSNAEAHLGARYLLRMDFADFFPSITAEDIRHFVEQHRGLVEDWDDEDVDFFTSIVTRRARLTIGAPTSPHLSNLLCHSLDAVIAERCAQLGVTYTRYADDMFFSTTERDLLHALQGDIAQIVEQLECPSQLEINNDKTHHASKAGRISVTGLVLTQDGNVSIGRSRKRYLRSLVYRYAELTSEEQRSLAGHLAFVQSIEPDFINRLVLKYGPRRVREAMTMEPGGE